MGYAIFLKNTFLIQFSLPLIFACYSGLPQVADVHVSLATTYSIRFLPYL